MEPQRLPVDHWIALCHRHIDTYTGNIEHLESRSRHVADQLGISGFRESKKFWLNVETALAGLPPESTLNFIEAIYLSTPLKPDGSLENRQLA